MKLILMLLALALSKESFSQVLKVVKFDCPDSLGYITNQVGTTREVTFILEPHESPTFYYVENFTHKDFHKIIYENDSKVISKVKIAQIGHKVKPYDFLYAYTSKNELIFYYILKDWEEEDILNPRKPYFPSQSKLPEKI